MNLRPLALGLSLLFVSAARAGDGKDPQFLEPNDWFFLPYPENMNGQSGQISLGRLEEMAADVPGAKRFWVDRENRSFSGKTYYQTRMAQPQDLHVGRRVIHPFNAIKTPEDKKNASWGFHRIVNLGDAPRGKVVVHGSSNPEVDLSSLRVIVGGEADPKLTLTGKEDAHHFHPEHWLVMPEGKAPDADGAEAKLAIAIRPPAKRGEDGVFLLVYSGAVVTTKHAWHSHVASRGELKTGMQVAFYPSGIDLPDRALAYNETWWIGPLTSVGPSAIKIGNSSVRAELLRVVE